MLTAIYRWLPKTNPPWRTRSGAEYWRRSSGKSGDISWPPSSSAPSTAAYGIVGSFIAILLWCYYSVTVIFLGAEFVQVASASHQPPKRGDPIAGPSPQDAS
ncbi:MAG: hypothetical protein R3B90_12660 [Planctomycetaceae bacterium]